MISSRISATSVTGLWHDLGSAAGSIVEESVVLFEPVGTYSMFEEVVRPISNRDNGSQCGAGFEICTSGKVWDMFFF